MSLIPTLAAVRYGTGLSPRIAPPEGRDEMMHNLQAADLVVRRVPQPGWSAKLDMTRRWMQFNSRSRRDPSEENRRRLRHQSTVLQRAFHEDATRMLVRASITADGFRERLAWFWANHFTVRDGGGLLRRSVVGYQEDAIRPYVTGTFSDLLTHAVLHPAMLLYLDQSSSVGPNSARAGGRRGLNENLAREVLELHTLGVEAGYSQVDVREFAELLTGVTVSRDGALRFDSRAAEPGAERVLGTEYGGRQARLSDVYRALEDLALHPATAAHVSRKLAVHFISDAPPDNLIARMVHRWRETGGNLLRVYDAMLDHPAAWQPDLTRVRRPLELMAATARALGIGAELTSLAGRDIRQRVLSPLAAMGQPFQRPAGPDGWPEDPEVWITPQGLAERIAWAMKVPGWVPEMPDPRDFVDTALGPLASARTRFAATAAEDRAAGIGLVLSSPEFQRR